MQTVGPLVAIIPFLLIYGILLWALVKFYRALARIGEELSEIKTVLRLRLAPPERPGEP
jgi:flagellar biogenesis protein FliO